METGGFSPTDLDLEGLSSVDSDKHDRMQLSRTEEELSTASYSSDSRERNLSFHIRHFPDIFLWNFKTKHEKYSPKSALIPEASCLYSILKPVPHVTMSPTTCLLLPLPHLTIGHLQVCGNRGNYRWDEVSINVCVCVYVRMLYSLS